MPVACEYELSHRDKVQSTVLFISVCSQCYADTEAVKRFCSVLCFVTASTTMHRWAGRVAMVTGASSGIGAAIAKELVKKGLKVVGMARRVENIEALSASLRSSAGQLYPVKADITQHNEVFSVFRWAKRNLGGVDVLVNSAGVASANTLIDGPIENWRHILDVNVLGLSICTKEAIHSMKERGVDDGHIVHINSVTGHVVPPTNTPMYMYAASKAANLTLTEGLRRELLQMNSKIRLTSVSPGIVRTDMRETSGLTDPHEDHPYLEPQDVVDAVIYVLGTPPHVQVHEVIIRPVGESFV
ncbi:Dehydrogenase/reductase SDR family member 11 [Zootermopsis nevadensis]|uniref:Dehydrogenase/reductase SDR family member 11 n=2 Tax=Zootermopsis nevadensis TaxID=136037 RepID=A0A067QY13_ZOONE|nr:Dehydrogenase/reductase SDR family member 11 [Zootermopsis nevadensis]